MKPRKSKRAGQRPDKSGPIHTARAGSVTVPVYHAETRTGPSWTVAWYESGRRLRRSFSDRGEAEAYALAVARQIARTGAGSLSLTGSELLAYRRAVDALQSVGVPLDIAAADYAAARALVGSAPLVEVARDYAARHRGAVDCPETARIVEELL